MDKNKTSEKTDMKFWKNLLNIVIESKDIKEFCSQLIDNVVSEFKSDGGFVYLIDRKHDLLKLVASYNPYPNLIEKLSFPINEGLTGWIVRTGETLVFKNACYRDDRFKLIDKLAEETYEAYLGVPIKDDSIIIGALSIKKRRPHQWKEKEIKTLEEICTLAGKALAKLQEIENSKKKIQMFDSLSQISTTIISDRYLQEILNLIVSITAEATSSKICSIMLLDENKNELVIKASQSLSPSYLNKPNLKVGESVSGKAVLEKKSIAVFDVTKDVLYRYPEIAKKEGLVSLLAVPMMIKGKVIGVINSYTDYPHQFTEEEINMLMSVAAQAAIALENTKLMEEKLAIQEALESRKLVEKAKGILMKQKNISEDEAYNILRKQSMDRRKSLKEVAEAIILANELK